MQLAAAAVRGVFRGLMYRLGDANIDAAVKYMSPSIREQFTDIFSRLGPDLGAAVAQFGDIARVNLGDEIGEIVLMRTVDGVPRAFLIQMMRGDDGIWRVGGM